MRAIPYDDARLLIQDGDVVFVNNTTGWFLPAIIEFFTRSRYSHVGIAFWLRTGDCDRLMMVETQGGSKRRIVNLSYYGEDNLDVVTPPKAWDEVCGKALERLHQVPYGWLDALYVGLREFLLKYFRIRIPAADMPGETCSEFVARVFKLEDRDVSPQRLYETLVDMGCTVRTQSTKNLH